MNDPSFTFHKLESAYCRAKSRGKVGLKKVSILIMITDQMKTNVLILGGTRDEMKYLTPKEFWKITNEGFPKKTVQETK